VSNPNLLVYIAGPYSPTADQKAWLSTAPTEWAQRVAERQIVIGNIAAAEQTAIWVAEAGFAVLCPHSNTAHEKFVEAQPYEFWIAATLRMLRVCDALMTVEGWEKSPGARGEVEWCTANKVPVSGRLCKSNTSELASASKLERMTGSRFRNQASLRNISIRFTKARRASRGRVGSGTS